MIALELNILDIYMMITSCLCTEGNLVLLVVAERRASLFLFNTQWYLIVVEKEMYHKNILTSLRFDMYLASTMQAYVLR